MATVYVTSRSYQRAQPQGRSMMTGNCDEVMEDWQGFKKVSIISYLMVIQIQR